MELAASAGGVAPVVASDAMDEYFPGLLHAHCEKITAPLDSVLHFV
jgi:hypothetical protein